jgi:uncharacterized protein YabE (DUF348 family)
LPDITALRAPDDPAARAALRAEMQSTWTGEIPVLRDLAGPAGDAEPAEVAQRRARHAAADDAHPAPEGTEPGRSWLLVPRPEGRRGRHAATDLDETTPISATALAEHLGAADAALTVTDQAAAEDAADAAAPEDRVETGGPAADQDLGVDDPAADGRTPRTEESNERGTESGDPASADSRSTASGDGVTRSSRRGWSVLRTPTLILGVATACLLTAGAGTVAALDKTVTIVVDGQPQQVSTLSTDVAGALRAAGLSVSAHDAISPTVGTPISDGSQIRLDRGRQVTVVIDGTPRQIWTTDENDAALAALGVTDRQTLLAADRSRRDAALDAVTARTVVLKVAGRSSSTESTGATVADLLRQKNVVVGPDDIVEPAGATALTDGMTVTVTRRTVQTQTVRRKVAQPADRTVKDDSIRRHFTKITKGRTGIEELTYRTVTINGIRGGKTLAATTVVRPAEATTTHIGTKIVNEQDAWNVPWDQLAQCESTNHWDTNTGNGTYGGLQFMVPTWLEFGGGEFASRPDLATRAEQIKVAERLYAQQGLAPWACARILGWGFGKYTGSWTSNPSTPTGWP